MFELPKKTNWLTVLCFRYFSDAVSDDANRREFVKNIVAMYHKFNLDGIDMYVSRHPTATPHF